MLNLTVQVVGMGVLAWIVLAYALWKENRKLRRLLAWLFEERTARKMDEMIAKKAEEFEKKYAK